MSKFMSFDKSPSGQLYRKKTIINQAAASESTRFHGNAYEIILDDFWPLSIRSIEWSNKNDMTETVDTGSVSVDMRNLFEYVLLFCRLGAKISIQHSFNLLQY